MWVTINMTHTLQDTTMENIRKYLNFILIGAVAFFGFSPAVTAQDVDSPDVETAAADVADDTDAAPAANEENIIGLFRKGGLAMWGLLFLSICAVTLVIYNAIMVRNKTFLQPDTVEQLKPAFADLDFEQAQQICDDNPGVLSNIIAVGIDRVDPDHLDPNDIKEGMEEASTEELAAPFGMIAYLSSIATLSPMVGLLGTVSGMIKAFNSIATQGMGNAGVLAANIQEALITTASGLLVAIPAMIAYLVFKNRYAKIAAGVSKNVGDIYFEMLKSLRRNAA